MLVPHWLLVNSNVAHDVITLTDMSMSGQLPGLPKQNECALFWQGMGVFAKFTAGQFK